MTSKLAKAAFLISATTFFAVLALDIAVPGVVLSLMALSNWVVLSSGDGRMKQRGQAA
jgi:hypothetical protein